MTATIDIQLTNGASQVDYFHIAYEYDAKRRLVRRTETTPSVPSALPTIWETTYDANDNVRTLTFPDRGRSDDAWCRLHRHRLRR
ncbi:MAG: hypothetical protein KF764_23535 [Labilithrix sp.]|nr:hypothetical protein [Labilithrix sp.]MBX3222908.1 hypothetical protein [Labilithrix sp.]